MRIYKLHANVTAGTNNSIAQLDIVEDGKIQAVSWAGAPIALDTANDEFRVEVSFSSSNTLDSNDIRQAIDEIGVGQASTSALLGGVGNINKALSGLNINVIAGERVHMHSFASTGVGGRVSCFLYVEDGSGGKTRSRRIR